MGTPYPWRGSASAAGCRALCRLEANVSGLLLPFACLSVGCLPPVPAVHHRRIWP